jgi:hypothetical protein
VADVRKGRITDDDLSALQKALEAATPADDTLGEDGERVHTSSLVDQARNRLLRPVIQAPAARTTQDATIVPAGLDPVSPATTPGDSASGSAAEAAATAMAGHGGKTRRSSSAAEAGTAPGTATPAEPAGGIVTSPPRTGADYAREAIEQLEGVLTHLGPRLEKADFSQIDQAERARFDALKQRLLGMLGA